MPAQDYISAQSIATLGGASVAVLAVANTLHYLLKVPGRWSASIMSLALAFGTQISFSQSGWFDYLIAFINSCVLFCTSLGLSDTVLKTRDKSQGLVEAKNKKKKTWNHDWLRDG
jgi:hypothetical protein